MMIYIEANFMKITTKNNNAITINLNDDLFAQLKSIATHYQRKPAELLRLLITPVIINEYAKIMIEKHEENKQSMQEAIFKNEK